MRQKRTVGGPHEHKQVAHHRSGSCPCAAHNLVFAAGLDSYCAHGNPAAGDSAGAAAIVVLCDPVSGLLRLLLGQDPHDNPALLSQGHHFGERRQRDVGLGPKHDWSSHAADAFGLMAMPMRNLRGGQLLTARLNIPG